MARANGKLTDGQVADWFGGLDFDRQLKVLTALAALHGKVREERISALKRELAALGATIERKLVSLGGNGKRKAAPIKAKYRDPSTGATWSGRGRMATWLAAKVKAGEKPSRYLAK